MENPSRFARRSGHGSLPLFIVGVLAAGACSAQDQPPGSQAACVLPDPGSSPTEPSIPRTFQGAAGARADVAIPTEAEWQDHGVAFPTPTTGWDLRLEGAISPAGVVKKDGTYILYYIAADGNRYDGGPRNRALGAALSTDGIRFERWRDNPVLTYQPSAPNGENVVEEGVFSASVAVRADDGAVVMLFGGMEAIGPTSVNGSGILAISDDGLDFRSMGRIISPNDPVTIGSDELFPVSLMELGPECWVAYYITTGSEGHDWSWAAALGAAPDQLGEHTLVLDSRNRPYPGGSDPIWVSDDQYVVPVLSGWGGDRALVEFRLVDAGRPTDLSVVAASREFTDLFHLTVFLDRERETWFLYYLDGPGESIRVKTAPMRQAP